MKNDITINVKESGLLLQFLYSELKSTPRGKVKSYLEHRQISVNGTITTKFDFPLSPGDAVKILKSGGSIKPHGIEIIYEDEYFVAVNKPSKLLTVATEGEKLKTAYALLSESRRDRIFVLHRLDRDTSGVLLFAKSRELRDQMQEEWNEIITLREYLAICEGIFEEKKGRCDSLIAENSVHVMYSGKVGKRAITDYEVIHEAMGFSLVKVRLKTGRKNQIRVHMKELSHPVVGDKKYGSSENPIGRLGLHASALGFIHPVTGKEVIIRAPKERKFALPKEKCGGKNV